MNSKLLLTTLFLTTVYFANANVEDFGKKVDNSLIAAQEKMHNGLESAKDSINKGIDAAREKKDAAIDYLAEKMHSKDEHTVERKTKNIIQRNPLTSVAVALISGLALALFLFRR